MALVDMALDLQIAICTFLHPCDILTLRQTCKTFQLVTRQRIVWIEGLHQVCLENKLFLPSFPIPDMSDVELERAATAPRRWIELCTSFGTQAFTGSDPEPSSTTRIIDNPLSKNIQAWDDDVDVILVPGGRYVVGSFPLSCRLGVWDLGYLSSADCKLIASVESSGKFGGVQATSDGMGLVILTLRPCCIYEIYPQSETPQLTQIANLNYHYYHASAPAYLSPDKVIWHIFHQPKTILRVWDYRLNASASFTTPVDAKKADVSEVCATQTAIIILTAEEILIWAIPPLSLRPPDFNDDNPTWLRPQIRVKFPHGLGLHPEPKLYGWRMISSWYIDSSQPLYFDKVYTTGAKLDRFKIIIKPGLSGATLHFINTLPIDEDIFLDAYISPSMVCEDTLVSSWHVSEFCGIYTGSMLSRPTTTWHGDANISLPVGSSGSSSPICPASGRFVYVRDAQNIVVLDFLAPRLSSDSSEICTSNGGILSELLRRFKGVFT